MPGVWSPIKYEKWSLYGRAFLCLSVPLCTYVYFYVSLYLCVLVCTYVYLCVPLYIYVPMCTSMYLCVPLCTFVYLCVPLCIFVVFISLVHHTCRLNRHSSVSRVQGWVFKTWQDMT